MKEITSRDSKWVKLIKRLKEKKHRDSEGLFVIEGANLLEDAVRNDEEILMVAVRGGFEDQIAVPEIQNTFKIPGELFVKLTDTVTPQNVVAIVRKKDKEPSSGNNRFVVLDELQDPGNVGTIIRTAEAAGFSGIITIKGTADVYSQKVIRAAAGSLLRMPIIEGLDREDALEYLKNKGVNLFSCDMNGKDFYTDVDISENIGIIVGNEGNGVSAFFAENSHKILIPMNSETESLNAAVASGIVIYESVRQRGGKI